jgi:glucan biosynthesis protein
MRLSFEHNVNGADTAELRAVLKRGDKKVSETWLYRWTRS